MLSYENPINHSSNEPVVLDADAQAVTLKLAQSAYSALQFIYENIKTNSLTKSIRFNAMSVAQSDIKDLAKRLGGDEDEKQKEETKQNLLRSANQEIARLQEELGKGITKEGIGVRIGQMCKEVEDWWEEQGFGYTKGTISGWSRGASMSVEFNCNLKDFVSSYSENPVSDKAKVKAKKQALAELVELIPEQPGSDVKYVLDSEKNRQWIMNRLRERFPGIQIYKFENRAVHRSQSQFFLNRCHANFPVEDI